MYNLQEEDAKIALYHKRQIWYTISQYQNFQKREHMIISFRDVAF